MSGVKHCGRMRRIRTFMLIGMLLLLLLPRLFYPLPKLFDSWMPGGFIQQRHQAQDAALNDALLEASGHVERWHEAEWQQSLRQRLNHPAIGLKLLDASGHEIFRSGFIRFNGTPDRQAIVTEEGKVVGTVYMYVPDRETVLPTVVSIIIAAGIILLIWRQMGRYVVKPLEAMSAAARKIGGGELDFKLPHSAVLEVDEVRTALESLGSGIKQSVTRQSELEHQRRFYIGAIAHDLRTPLFALRGFLLRLERGLVKNPEQAARYLSLCVQKADRMERLVSDLFSYIKSDVPELSVHKERQELYPILERTLDAFRPLAQSKRIDIAVDGPREDCVIQGDDHLLERAIGNLLDNAIRYTAPEGRVRLQWHMERERVVFSVADSGPGISEKDLPHIFDPFYRAEASRNTETGGTGLGLTIAVRILTAHGGGLTARNLPQGGAEFTGWIALDHGQNTGML
ncbi:sensor histidine kinase [Paenibacillus piri]|uniref:histidine kinase n=1 Tax=Paenibacillus piri TaxID=2547395 RepID=A0A4R5KGA8_9BACL|nr:HAMP domain-containing sensor histidine kinase [Paenibacillus piri]TDF93735.1 HAMP domain-containing histidine kinase [Paenibacillus piri]